MSLDIEAMAKPYKKSVLAGAAVLVFGIVGIYLLPKLATLAMRQVTDEWAVKSQEQNSSRSAELERQQQAKQAAQWQAQRQAEQERRQAAFERDRRTAFEASYVAPEGCDNPPSERAFTECVNHKMRARKAFFSTYGEARLSPLP